MTEAYDISSAGLLSNISPASAVERLRFVATSTGTSDIPSVSAFGTGTNAPCASRPLHPQQKIADAKAAAVKRRTPSINTITQPPTPDGITPFDTAQLAANDATSAHLMFRRKSNNLGRI